MENNAIIKASTLKSIKKFCDSKTYLKSGIRLLPETVIGKFEYIIKLFVQNEEGSATVDHEKIKLLSSFIRKYRLEQIDRFRGSMFAKGTITITFGEVAENGPTMQKIGNMAREGFTNNDLMNIKEYFTQQGIISEYYNLNDLIEGRGDPASLLVLRNATNHVIGNNNSRSDVDLYNQLLDLDWDKKAMFKGVVKNKNARHNLVFSDFDQDPAYEEGRGTVINWPRVPLLQIIKTRLVDCFGEKASDMHGEGNYYFNTAKCGIGFHGDSERKKVIAIRLGKSIPIVFQWIESIPMNRKKNFTPTGQQIVLNVNHGDIYIMSEKATGNDWMKKTQYHLRHSAGCENYTGKYNVKL